jgi:hypothetical protein
MGLHGRSWLACCWALGHTRGCESQDTAKDQGSIAAVYRLDYVLVCLCDLVMLRTSTKRENTFLTRCRLRGVKGGEEEKSSEGVMCYDLDMLGRSSH